MVQELSRYYKENYMSILTSQTEPVIKELLIKFKELGLTLKEQLPLFQEAGYPITAAGTIGRWKRKFGLTDPKLTKQKRRPGDANGNQKLGFIEGEIWKPIITDRFNASDYEISQYGNVIGKRGYKLGWHCCNGYMRSTLSLKISDYSNDAYIPTRGNGKGLVAQSIDVHRIVAEIFLPRPVPLCFSEIWPTLDKKQRDWIQSGYVVDHIDDDKGNPHVDNLRWVTVRGNNKWVKENKR